MSYSNQLEFKGINRKLYPNPSATNLTNKARRPPQNFHGIGNGYGNTKRNGKFYRDDLVEDEEFESRNPSRSDVFLWNSTPRAGIQDTAEEQGSMVNGESRVSKKRQPKNHQISALSQNEQTVIELRERLRNIHHFYKIRIEEQRMKNLEKNQIFIGVIEDLQHNHNSKLAKLQESLQELDNEKQDVNYVDERMQSVKTTIQQILGQSRELKQSNQEIEKQIMKRQLVIKDKQEELGTLKQQTETMRNVVQNFQRLKLKENRRNKELLEIIETTMDT